MLKTLFSAICFVAGLRLRAYALPPAVLASPYEYTARCAPRLRLASHPKLKIFI
jgi:hypothetical protein